MSTVHTIDTLEALHALSDSLKVEILECLRQEPLTVVQLAKRLNQKPTKLYYHIGELEKHGLLVVAETRQKGNLLEKYYRPAADFFRVDPALFQKGPEGMQAFYRNVTDILDRTAVGLRTAIDAGRVTEEEAVASRRTMIRSRLSVADTEEFGKRLDALLEEFGKRSSPGAEAAIGLTVIFYREKPDEPLKD